MGAISEGYESLWKLVIRPPRSHYNPVRMGPNLLITFSGVRARRTDFRVQNRRGLMLECSHFEPVNRPAK
jgi:hypothetical protein